MDRFLSHAQTAREGTVAIQKVGCHDVRLQQIPEIAVARVISLFSSPWCTSSQRVTTLRQCQTLNIKPQPQLNDRDFGALQVNSALQQSKPAIKEI
jgi:hypothetical protein